MYPRESGPYLLLRKLSQSALVETYRAGERDGQEVQRVVLLCFFNTDADDATWLAETAQAGRRALKGLAASSLGSAVDSGEVEGTAYLAYDYISGGDLRTLMDRSRSQGAPVSLGHALLITNRIAQALLAAWQHESRALHGFVVPQLVMLSTEGDVQLLGLEVASRLRKLLAVGTIRQEVGSYLAPEVVPEGQPSTTDDVFSLGALLYELATGRTLPTAPPGAYEAIIEDARLASGGPLPEAVTDLLDSSLAPGPKRHSLESWQARIESEVVSGNYEASAFDLALYLHGIFADELQAVDPPPEPADPVTSTEPALEEIEALEQEPVEASLEPEAMVEDAEIEAVPVEVPADIAPVEASPERGEEQTARSGGTRRIAVAAAIAALALVSFSAYKLFPSSSRTATELSDASLVPAEPRTTGRVRGAQSPPVEPMTDLEVLEPRDSSPPPVPARNRPVERTTTLPAATTSAPAQPAESQPQPQTPDPRAAQSSQDPVADQQVAVPESSPPEPAVANEPDRSTETSIPSSLATLGTAGDGDDRTGNNEAITAAEIDAKTTDSRDAELEITPGSSAEEAPLDIEGTELFAPIELESNDGDNRVGSATGATIQQQAPSNVEPAPAEPPAPVTSRQVERSSTPMPVEPVVQVGDLVGPGPGVVVPRRTNRVEPIYPMVARRLKKGASVSVRTLIDENGQVLKVEIMGAEAGYGFDVAALNAARKTTWEPATKGGVPVKMWWTLRIEFKL